MRQKLSIISAVGLSVLLFAVLAANPSSSTSLRAEQQPQEKPQTDDTDGKPVSNLREFMRLKLAASSKILEGLTTEDMALVKDGARELNKMSLSERWRAHNDVMYKQFSGEFQRITKDLIVAAEEENLDQATLKWMGVTMACMECHRYVRNTLVVEAN